jgi:hypothetical protein
MAACTYAATYWDKVCHDGRIALKSGYPASVNGVALNPGLPFSSLGPVPNAEDCTHFISCCVGSGSGTFEVEGHHLVVRGGGLHLESPFSGSKVYGETYAPRLVGALIKRGARFVGRQFQVTHDAQTRTVIQKELKLGDILAYASKETLDKYEHMTILVGADKIACHTTNRFFVDYNDIYFPWVSLIRMP